MKKRVLFILFIFATQFLFAQKMKLGLLVYGGGGDWYANPTSLPNLIKYANQNIKTRIKTILNLMIKYSF